MHARPERDPSIPAKDPIAGYKIASKNGRIRMQVFIKIFTFSESFSYFPVKNSKIYAL